MDPEDDNGMDKQFNAFKNALAELVVRLLALEQRQAAVEGRLDLVESRLATLDSKLEILQSKVQKLAEDVAVIKSNYVTKEDLHKLFHAQTWRLFGALGLYTAAVYFVARFVH